VMLTNAEQCEASPGSYWVLNVSPECDPILNASPEWDPVLNKVYIRDAHECRAVCASYARTCGSIFDRSTSRRIDLFVNGGARANW